MVTGYPLARCDGKQVKSKGVVMRENRLFGSIKVCGTCALWGGARATDPLRATARFDMDQKGECLGGGFNRAKMAPMATCNKWQRWPALRG
jgi:hypothetical protein